MLIDNQSVLRIIVWSHVSGTSWTEINVLPLDFIPDAPIDIFRCRLMHACSQNTDL